MTRRAGLAGVWPLHPGFDPTDNAGAAFFFPLTCTRPGAAPRIVQ